MLSHYVIFFKIKPRVHQDLPNVENVLFLDVTHWTLVPNVENASTRGTHNSGCMWKNNQKSVCVCVGPVFGGKTYLKERSNKNFSCAFRAAVSLIQN